jgi:gamma-glutamyltranspeptidase/glutathione hydrolase
VQRPPVCRAYRGRQVCGFPPPTSGAVTALQMLGMLERFDVRSLSPSSVEAAHLLAEVGRYAYADRDRYVADPAFVDVPVKALLDDEYLEQRAALIDPAHASTSPVPAGEPPQLGTRYVPGRAPELPSTSHFVVWDSFGNVASMTTSVEFMFGSHLMVEGFLLNNQLTDFSFLPEVEGQPVANAVAPGKRPRSSMAPTLVLDENGAPLLALGSPGGSRIIPFVVQTLVGVLDWGLDVQQAIALPHVANRNGATELEDALRSEKELRALKAALESMGHVVEVGEMNSGLHAIARKPDGTLEGGADPRREGLALGE